MPFGRTIPTASFAGVRWSQVAAVFNATWQTVLWSQDFTQWLAISTDLGVGRVITSPDGETWTLQAASLPIGTFRDVAESTALGQVLAVSVTNTMQFSISVDGGVTWDAGAAPFGAINGFSSIVFAGPPWDTWIAGTLNAAAQMVATSPDGVNWTLRAVPNTGFNPVQRAIAFSPDLQRAVLGIGDARIVRSDDVGVTWVNAGTPPGVAITDVIWIAELQLFVASALGANAFTSPDGDVWTARAMPLNANWRSLAWSATASRIIAVNDNVSLFNGGARFASSTDGLTWRAEYGPTLDYGAIAEGGITSTFVAITPVVPGLNSQVAFSRN